MSKAHLTRKLNAQIGSSPGKLILYHRMELARDLLELSSYFIEEIAQQCGFSGVPSFSRKFKQEFGCSPSKFRKSVLNEKSKILIWKIPLDEALFNQLIDLKKRHDWVADFFINTIENFHNELFTIEKLASSLFMSSSTLNRRVNFLFGIPPIRLVLDLKLQYAIEMLVGQNKTVSETAFLSGFFDAAHLNRYFKQAFGCSPRAYKAISRPFLLIDRLKLYK
jgi:AraC-like DNA-binding protein